MKITMMLFLSGVCHAVCSSPNWAVAEPNVINVELSIPDTSATDPNDWDVVSEFACERWDCGKWKGWDGGMMVCAIVVTGESYYMEISKLTMPATYCFSGAVESYIDNDANVCGSDARVEFWFHLGGTLDDLYMCWLKSCEQCDLNGDGTVDLLEYAIIAERN